MALAVIAAVVLFFHLYYYRNINDPDTFYHIRHAWLYRTQGLFQASFPWLVNSAIGIFPSDLWYGFHVFLVPFTLFSDLAVGIEIAAILLTFAALGGYFLIFKNLRVPAPLLWALFLFFSAPDLNYRLAMVRPHTATLILGLLIFLLAIREKRWGVFLASAALASFHLAMFWLPLLITAVLALANFLAEKKIKVRDLLMSAAGVISGWILRPNFWNAAKLAYVQIVQLFLEKSRGIPLRVGSELRPADWSIFWYEMAPVLLFVILAAAQFFLLVRSKRFLKITSDERMAILGSLILSATFGAVTILMARRAVDLWAAFSLLFVGLILKQVIPQCRALWARYKIAISAAVFAVVLIPAYITIHFSSTYKAGALPLATFRQAAAWLKENAQPGEVIFNLRWDNFPMLFFWNQQNFYVNGMDPIFEYAASPRLWWLHHFMEIDGIAIQNGRGYTCGASTCSDVELIPVRRALHEDFGASYVFLQSGRNPIMYRFFSAHPEEFEKVFSSDGEAIFRIL